MGNLPACPQRRPKRRSCGTQHSRRCLALELQEEAARALALTRLLTRWALGWTSVWASLRHLHRAAEQLLLLQLQLLLLGVAQLLELALLRVRVPARDPLMLQQQAMAAVVVVAVLSCRRC